MATYRAPDTDEVRERMAQTGEDWPTAYAAIADYYNPVDTTPDPRERIESDPFNEGWQCAPGCRNSIDTDGFYPCDPATGEEVEPTRGPWDGKSIKCAACGRVMDQTTNRREADGWTVAVIARFPAPVTA